MTDVKTVIETVVPVSAEAEVPKGKVEKKGGKRIGYNYIILKSLKESPKNDVVKCIYIKSLVDFGVCVIKEGTAGELKDKHGRDIKDRLVWQKELHKLLQDKVRVPRYIGSFEENGNYYLAIEHIKGKTLGNLFKKYGKDLREALITGNKTGVRFLGYLLKIIRLLDKLHQNDIVHRDVTSANFIITPTGKVALIDMELSYSLRHQAPAPPFQLGTYGYMSPEQLVVAMPTIKEDVFSVGAILLQSWACIVPVKLTEVPYEELEDKVAFFIPDKQVGNIVLQCLQPDAEKRPTLEKVYQVLEKYRSDLKRRIGRAVQKSPLLHRDQVIATVQQVISTLASPLLATEGTGWFAENNNVVHKNDKNRINKAWYTSFHIGSSGVLYFLSRAYLVGLDIEMNRPNIEHTLTLIEEKYIDRIDNVSSGLHFGADGIAACLAGAMHCDLIDYSEKHIDWIKSLLRKGSDAPGILSGKAGQGLANLLCRVAGHAEEVDVRLYEYVQYLLNVQDNNGAWTRMLSNANNKSPRITCGFANGVAGIIYFLLEYARHYNNRESIFGAEKGLQWLMKNAIRTRGGIEWNSFEGKKIPPSWCDGGQGIALTFMNAFVSLGNPIYKEFAMRSLSSHPHKVFDNNNLSQYNGLSGLGEIYLEAHRLLGGEQWLEYAGWCAQTIMRLKKHHRKYGPYWQVVNERQPVPGFMIGNAGVLHFLLRYCFPDRINFPLIPDYRSQKVISSNDTHLLSIRE